MSKKKKTEQKPCKCTRKRCILIAVLVIVVLAIGFGVYRLATYNSTNQSGWMNKDEKTEYNSAITQQAWLTSRIARDEILIINTVNKTLGGDTEVELYVYKLPQGAKATDYYHLSVRQIPADSGLEHVGTATCKLAGGKLESVYNLLVTYMR